VPCGGKRIELRRIVDAIRWVLHHDAKWRDLPAEYGAPTTSWRWYDRWCSDGTWQQIAAALELPAREIGREPGHRPPRSKARESGVPIDVPGSPVYYDFNEYDPTPRLSGNVAVLSGFLEYTQTLRSALLIILWWAPRVLMLYALFIGDDLYSRK
jgi:hypothetical protein